MKKIVILLILGFSVFAVNAQKVSGTVYSEHDAINKTKALWAAFVKGDKEAYLSFYADSIYYGENGKVNKVDRNTMVYGFEWWKGVENLKIADDSPAIPDAIKYNDDGLWVQDWLRITGTHTATGINVDIPCHFLYRFNKEGKIDAINGYGDFSSFFEEVNNSSRTIENGIVYKYHPYINIVRKAVNAYCSKNPDKMFEYYTPDAVFSNLVLTNNQTYGVDEMKKEMKTYFENESDIAMIETGHPVCVWYEKETYVVYSWWLFSYTTTEGVRKSGIPMMLTDIFSPDGKIVSEAVYYSSNHFE